MKKLVFALLLAPTFALAQGPQPPAPTEYTIKLTLPELQTIGAALTKRPYEEVANLLANINAQVNTQIPPPAVSPAVKLPEVLK